MKACVIGCLAWSLVATTGGAEPTRASPGEPKIEVWYGSEQRFGHRGVPQKWINILGRIVASTPVVASYQLNGAEPEPLSLGPNYTRLAEVGDFNVEISVDLLRRGANELVISAKLPGGDRRTARVSVIWDPVEKVELPYSIEWRRAKQIQDLAQVVDGHWKLTDQGVRTIEPYYDRVIAFGSRSWENFEVATTVTFHGRRIPGPRDGGRNVIHAAIASRWPGHDADEHQPHVKWYPLGATSEFMLTDWPDNCRWRILGGAKRERHSYQESGRTIRFDVPYAMRHRVATGTDGATEYSVKLWRADAKEPVRWDLVGREQPDDVSRGGALLLAHYSDVTFGDVHVSQVVAEAAEVR